jgi:hypothetical protein
MKYRPGEETLMVELINENTLSEYEAFIAAHRKPFYAERHVGPPEERMAVGRLRRKGSGRENCRKLRCPHT